ncbi:MAG: hypothetical protein JWN48_382, partial [Myxococcaceae bacterium]|nr:hypothetical protein [Myxococcaceae bacterium]
RHDLQTGAVSRTMSVTWTGAEHSMMTAPVLAAEGTVYVIAPPSLYAFEPDSQTLLWSVTSMLAGMPALADDKLLALDGQRLSAFAAKTGALLWQCSEAVALRYPPVAAHGFAYVASESATYAVDLSTGKVAWQTPFGGWLSIAAGRLFVAAADGTLHSFVLTAAEPLAP